MPFDLEQDFRITAATAKFIQDKEGCGISEGALRRYEENVYIPRHHWAAGEPVEAQDIDPKELAREHAAQAYEEESSRPELGIGEYLADHEAFDVTDDRFAGNCGSKVAKQPSLEDIDDRGWIPQMI